MDCQQTEWLSNDEYMRRLGQRAVEERIPLSGSFALTNRCNLRCVHCYVHGQQCPSTTGELPTNDVLRIVDEVVEAGCLQLCLTGGEPFLRTDFPDIYSHAKGKGLIVTVFTNATLTSDRLVSLLRDLPPYCVEVSLYGATAETYERITGVPGSFARCRAGIESLVKAGIRVALKTVAMTLNEHELDAIRVLANHYGADFRSDPAIFPRFDGDRAPIDLRLEPAKAITHEIATPDIAGKWHDFYNKFRDSATSDKLYVCGAGVTMFHVEPDGMLYPCLMSRHVSYDLKAGSFKDGWANVIPRIRQERVCKGSRCATCDKQVLCGYCPPFAKLDTGSEHGCPEYLCGIAEQRLAAIRRLDGAQPEE